MRSLDSAALAFGKIPTHGDFVRLGARRAIVDLLDQWLQEGVAEWKRQFTQNEESPAPVRLVFAHPQSDEVLVGSVVMSADRVGRRYPFLVARGLDKSDLNPVDIGSWPEAWKPFFEAADDLTRTATSGMTVEEVEAELAWLPSIMYGDSSQSPLGAVTGSEFWTSMWGSPDASEKYAVMLRLLQLREAGGTAAINDGGLSFPLPNDGGDTTGAAFWLSALDGIVEQNSAIPTIAWPAGGGGNSLLVFPKGATRRGAAAVFGAEVSQRTLFDMSAPMARPLDAVLALPPRFGTLLEQDDLTLIDLLNEL